METCCGYGYGPARKSHHLPRFFKGRRQCTGHRGRRGALRRQRPYLRASRFQGVRSLQRKENSSRDSTLASPEFGCVAALGPENGTDLRRPGSGILTRFPFDRVGARRIRPVRRRRTRRARSKVSASRAAARDRLVETACAGRPTRARVRSACVLRHSAEFTPRQHSERNSPISQGRLTHVQLLFTWNPSPLRSTKFSFVYLLLPPRSAPSGGSTRAHAQRFYAHRSAPSYSSGPGISGTLVLPRRPGIGRDAPAPSIFRAS